MKLVTLLISITFLFTIGCKTQQVEPLAPILVSPTASTASDKADALRDARTSKAAAGAFAARKANEANPEGLPKTAVEGELGVVTANLPPPSAEDLAAALERVNAALSGDLRTAQAGWKRAEAEAARTAAVLAAAEEKAKADAEAAAKMLNEREANWNAKFAEMKRASDEAVAKAKAEAEAKMKAQIGYIFFGGAALFVALGVGCLTMLSGLPFVGPKVILGCFGTAAGLAATGVLLIRAANSPWIGRCIVGTAVVAIAALALAYANQRHSEKSVVTP